MYSLKHYLFILIISFCSVVSVLGQGEKGNNLKLFSESQEVSESEYMLYITSLFHKIDSIKNKSNLHGYIPLVREELNEIDTLHNFVNNSIQQYSSFLDIRNFQMLKLLLNTSQTTIVDENRNLIKTYSLIHGLKYELTSIRNDTLLRKLIKDTLFLKKFHSQLKTLKLQYLHTDSLLNANINALNQLKVRGASYELNGLILINDIQKQQNTAFHRLISKEENFIWNARSENPDIKEKIKGAVQTEQKAVRMYFKNFDGKLFFLLFFSLLFFLFNKSNLNKIRKYDQLQLLDNNEVAFINHYNILSVVAVMLSIAPLFDLHAPVAYIEVLQFFLLITLSVLFYKNEKTKIFKKWLHVIVLYLMFTSGSHFHDPGTLQRVFMVGLNIYAILFGLSLYRNNEFIIPHKRFIKIVLVLFIIMNSMAILFNISGRFSLSQIFNTTAIFSIINAIALVVSVKIISESIILQVQAQRLKHGIFTPFSQRTIQRSFNVIFKVIIIGLWLIVFLTNLNMYSGIYDGFTYLFKAKIPLGVNFITLGNVVLFTLIIVIAHFLQKNIGYFLGDVGDEDLVSEQRSKLIMTRLILLVCGYLLAILVSGLPLDQITIIIGALGVGIGLGLQNIVNNFVSGIILIFDRPLRIGDSIEVGGMEGQIKEIGIRSSILLTPEGSEVIIPNGDILSQKIVNWTHSNTYKRVSFSLKIVTTKDREFIISTINSVIKSQEGLLTSKPSSILLESVTGEEYALSVLVWCSNVNKIDIIKSEIRYALFKAFEDIKIQVS